MNELWVSDKGPALKFNMLNI